MGESIKAGGGGKEVIEFNRDTIERTIRERIRAIIGEVVEAEPRDQPCGSLVSAGC